MSSSSIYPIFSYHNKCKGKPGSVRIVGANNSIKNASNIIFQSIPPYLHIAETSIELHTSSPIGPNKNDHIGKIGGALKQKSSAKVTHHYTLRKVT